MLASRDRTGSTCKVLVLAFELPDDIGVRVPSGWANCGTGPRRSRSRPPSCRNRAWNRATLPRRLQLCSRPYTTIPRLERTTHWEFYTPREIAFPVPSRRSTLQLSWRTRTGRRTTTLLSHFLVREIERGPCASCRRQFSKNQILSVPISLSEAFWKTRGGWETPKNNFVPA